MKKTWKSFHKAKDKIATKWLYTFVSLAMILSVAGVTQFVQFAQAAGSLPSGGLKLEQWETKPNGKWVTASLQSNNSDYSEGEVVPFRLVFRGNVGTQYQFSICRNYQNGNVRGYLFLDSYNASRAANPGGTINSTNGFFSGINVTIDSVNEVGGQGACSAGDRETIVTITKGSNSGDSYILWGGI